MLHGDGSLCLLGVFVSILASSHSPETGVFSQVADSKLAVGMNVMYGCFSPSDSWDRIQCHTSPLNWKNC